jgi:hypothetical protein
VPVALAAWFIELESWAYGVPGGAERAVCGAANEMIPTTTRAKLENDESEVIFIRRFLHPG